MPTSILMPALSPTMEEGTLAKWLVKEGDEIAPGDVIAEIETDKATMEVEAVDEGTVGRILIDAGTEGVKVNTPIAVLLGEGESADDIEAEIDDAGKKEPRKAAESPAVGGQQGGIETETDDEIVAGPRETPKEDAPSEKAATTAPRPPKASSNGDGRIFASPLARRVAADKGVELARLKGSGPHGRIIIRDVEAALESGVAREAPQRVPTEAPTMARAMPDDDIKRIFEDGTYEIVPHDGMRKTIARRLTQSKQTIPHFYLTVDCVIDELLASRARMNERAPKGEDGKPAYKLSVNDFVIKALATALQRIPDANACWLEEGMMKFTHSDIGVAVAIPGGLITPVVRRAETKGLVQISGEMKDFAARARARKLQPHEYQGGSTAVSNLGMYGIREFSAVINPPHATILAVGAGERRAVVEGDDIVIRTIMCATLSTDHRAVDGALGAELLAAFKDCVEDPAMMLV